MDQAAVAVVLPAIYAALQFEAVRRFRDSWKPFAHFPLAIIAAGFVAQYYAALVVPGAALIFPVVALGIASVMLAVLLTLHRRSLRRAARDALIDAAANVLRMEAFRPAPDRAELSPTA